VGAEVQLSSMLKCSVIAAKIEQRIDLAISLSIKISFVHQHMGFSREALLDNNKAD